MELGKTAVRNFYFWFDILNFSLWIFNLFGLNSPLLAAGSFIFLMVFVCRVTLTRQNPSLLSVNETSRLLCFTSFYRWHSFRQFFWPSDFLTLFNPMSHPSFLHYFSSAKRDKKYQPFSCPFNNFSWFLQIWADHQKPSIGSHKQIPRPKFKSNHHGQSSGWSRRQGKQNIHNHPDRENIFRKEIIPHHRSDNAENKTAYF